MGIKSFIQEKCISGCDICLEDCPTDVFALDRETGKARVAHPGDCWECLLCEEKCPGKAIQITPSAARKLWYPY